MEVYVVINRMTPGSEALAIFSSPENGLKFIDSVAGKTGHFCHIKRSLIRGYYQPPHHVFAAHTYDRREDVHILEGIYSKLSPARRAAGREGKTIEFSIDATEEIHIFMNE